MSSVFSQFITDVSAHIAESVPEIAWIDQYLGQDQTRIRPTLAYPAVLIDFDRTEYSMTGGANQLAESRISFRLLFDNYASSAQKAPEKARATALQIYETEKQLVEILHNWQPNGGYMQPLVRVSSASQNRNDIGLKIRILSFTTAWNEDVSF